MHCDAQCRAEQTVLVGRRDFLESEAFRFISGHRGPTTQYLKMYFLNIKACRHILLTLNTQNNDLLKKHHVTPLIHFDEY